MSCTNPNCECKAGSYANLNPPNSNLYQQVDEIQRTVAERSKARRVRRGAAAYAVTLAGFKIELKRKSNNNFSVIYGKQFKDGLTYADAAHELGECIMHALALEGKLD